MGQYALNVVTLVKRLYLHEFFILMALASSQGLGETAQMRSLT